MFSKLRAYDRATRTTRTVAEPTNISMEFAVTGKQIVYTDPRPILIDLAKNTSRTLSDQFATAPAIAGDTVLWSASEPTADDLDVYGFDLRTNKRTALINPTGNQVNATLVGETLVWQDEADKEGKGKIKRKLLKEAKDTAKPRQPEKRVPDTQQSPEMTQPSAAAAATFTRPVYKGMHLALGGYNNDPDPAKRWGGWYFSTGQPCNTQTCIVDGYGAPYNSFFGSYLAMETEFGYNTGRASPWGPTVADMMKAQQAAGARVIVRTWLPKERARPNPFNTAHPADTVNQVINLAKSYDWIKHV